MAQQVGFIYIDDELSTETIDFFAREEDFAEIIENAIYYGGIAENTNHSYDLYIETWYIGEGDAGANEYFKPADLVEWRSKSSEDDFEKIIMSKGFSVDLADTFFTNVYYVDEDDEDYWENDEEDDEEGEY